MIRKITCKLPRYIQYKERNKNHPFYVVKLVNGKSIKFGGFKTLREAKQKVDFFKKHGWIKEGVVLTKQKNNKFFYYDNKWGKYLVRKIIAGKMHYFGAYKTQEEAEKRVEELKAKNWNDTELGEKRKRLYFYRHINKTPLSVNSPYIIHKSGKHFGVYSDLKTALNDRDFFEECGWDEEIISNEYDPDRPNKYDGVELPPLPDRLKEKVN